MSEIRKNEDTKLWVFSLIKDNFVYEKYLDIRHSKKNIITKFRLSAHWLPIERMRYCKPKIPRQQRICTFCKIKIGTEYHALMECTNPQLQHIRMLYGNIDLARKPTLQTDSAKFEQFIFFMGAKEVFILPNLIKWFSEINEIYKKSYVVNTC